MIEMTMELRTVQAWEILNKHPEGVGKVRLCVMVGLNKHRSETLMIKMGMMGFLLSEDDKGHVYLFDPKLLADEVE